MPISPYRDGTDNLDAETKRVMGVAFEMVAPLLRETGETAQTQRLPRESSNLPRRVSAAPTSFANTH